MRRQAIEFRCVAQGRLHRVIQGIYIPHHIERIRDAALDANTFAFVVQLPLVAGCAVDTYELSTSLTLFHRGSAITVLLRPIGKPSGLLCGFAASVIRP